MVDQFDPARVEFLQRTDQALSEVPQTVALSLLNNTPGGFAGRGSTYVFEAVGDIEVTDSVELSTEPGVFGRIGPKFPRSATFRVRVHDNPQRRPESTGLFIPSTARAQHTLLRNLIGKLMYIDARASPPERIVWTLENVKGMDDNSAKNAFDVEVTAREILGGDFSEVDVFTEKGLVPVDVPDPSLLGIGPTTCAVATMERLRAEDVPRLSDSNRRQILPAYNRAQHGTTNPLLPDWLDYLHSRRSGPFIDVSGAHLQTSQYLRTLTPADCQISSIDTAERPDMSTLSYACMHLSGLPYTISFDGRVDTAEGVHLNRAGQRLLDVHLHAPYKENDPPFLVGRPPAPIILPDAFEPGTKIALIFVGDPYPGEKGGLPVGRLMVFIRGNFN